MLREGHRHGRIYAPRPRAERPGDPKCKPVFYRTCGVCAGFPSGQHRLASAQPCALRQLTVDGGARAEKCKHWARKSAPEHKKEGS